jgi:outer membrane protein
MRKLNIFIFCIALSLGVLPLSFSENREVALQLDECLAIAMQRNLGLQTDRYTPLLARDSVLEAWSQFDPQLSLNYLYSQQDIPESPGDAFQSTLNMSLEQQIQNAFVNTGIEGMLTTGGKYSLNFENSRFDLNFYSFFPETSLEQYNSDLRFEFSQPLLKNRGRLINTITIQQAERAAEESYYEWSERTTDLALAVEQTYWEMVYTSRQLDIAKQSLKRADDLLRINKAGLRVGTMAEVEVLEAEAEVALRQELVLKAQNVLEDTQDALKRLMNWFDGDRLDGVSLVASNSPEIPGIQLSEQVSLEKALLRRGNIWAARERIAQATLSEIFARNQRLPDLSINSSVTWHGLAPEGGDRYDTSMGMPTFPDRDITDAWDLLNDRDFYDWSIGIFLTYPLGNRGAKAKAARAQKQIKQAELGYEDLVQQVHADVRESIRQINTDRERLLTAAKAVQLRKERLRISQKSYELGLATSHDVLEIQEDYANAQVQELRALIDCMNAYARLSRVEGTYLKKHRMELERPFEEPALTGGGSFNKPGPIGPTWTDPFQSSR